MKPNKERQAGTKDNSSTKDQDMQVSQHSSKPHVLCWPIMRRTKVDYITHCPAVFVFLSGCIKNVI